MAQTSLVPVQFNGATLVTTLIDGVPYVALRPICESIGGDGDAQIKRIKRHPVLNSVTVVMTATGSDGKQYDMLMLPLDKLNGWLFGVSVSRVKPELRERLTVYQTECFGALAKHFGAGQGTRPMLVQSANTATEPPAIDVRTLLLSGQGDPVTLTAAQQALVDEHAWLMAGEAYQLAREHIARAIAYRTNADERTDPKNPRIASIIKGITLNQALAHAYWSEARSLQSIAVCAVRVAEQNLSHINALLAGKPKPKDMLF